MTLQERLRKPKVTHHQVSRDWEPYETVVRVHPVDPLLLEAADELDRLQAENEALRAALGNVDRLLSRVLHELAGSASLCWEPKPTGVFDSEQALQFVESAIKELRAAIDAAMKEQKP